MTSNQGRIRKVIAITIDRGLLLDVDAARISIYGTISRSAFIEEAIKQHLKRVKE